MSRDNEVPPKEWRSARQLQGYLGILKSAELACTNGAYVELDLRTIRALRQIICQAIHTERNHEAPRDWANDE